MEGCRIVNYTKEREEPLRCYMQRVFQRYSKEYVDYCIEHSSDCIPSILVVNQSNEIVGCHLYYCTKAIVEGVEIETKWGHDMFLDEAYRADMGLALILYTRKELEFGLGLTEINREIRKRLKTTFYDGVFNYYAITRKAFISPFQKMTKKQSKLRTPDVVEVDKYHFSLISDATRMIIPNNGFWYKGYYNLDFSRDLCFLKDRFFNNEVFKYAVYALDSDSSPCYFVVRQILYHGFPALTLSDFRYCPEQSAAMVKAILDAVWKVAIMSNIGVVVFLAGDRFIDSAMKHRIHYKKPIDFISTKNIMGNISFSITGADSDADFLK